MTTKEKGLLLLSTAVAPLEVEEVLRAPLTVQLDASRIHIPPFEEDPRFMELWTSYMNGESWGWQTRIPTKDVIPGFAAPNGEIHSDIDRRFVSHITEKIRGGRRPTIHLYEGEYENAERYFCADDEVVLAAYRALGVESAPALILGTPKIPLREARVGARLDPRTRLPVEFDVRGSARPQPAVVPGPKPQSLVTYFDAFIKRIDECSTRIREFHVPGGEVHYHQTLMSYLVRARRAVVAMRDLSYAGQFEVAMVVARGLYEMVSVLYLDWLDPEFFGPRLHSFLQLSPPDLKRQVTALEEKLVRDGAQREDAASVCKCQRKLVALCTNIRQRCELMPSGETMHAKAYRELSKFAHHGPEIAALFGGYLEDDDADPAASNQDSYIRWMTRVVARTNHSLALLCECVEADMGRVESAPGEGV